MTKEAFERAFDINDEICELDKWRKEISEGGIFNKRAIGCDAELLQAGKDAMLAVVDERIDANKKELEAL